MIKRKKVKQDPKWVERVLLKHAKRVARLEEVQKRRYDEAVKNTPIPPRDAYTGSPLDTFDKAIKTVNGERGRNYGHPAVNFDRVAKLRAIIDDCPDPRIRVGLGEIADRLARLVENPYHLDAYIDITGYARANVMIIQRENCYPDNPSQGTVGPETDGD